MFKTLILLEKDNIDCSLDLIEVCNLISVGKDEKLIYGIGFNLNEDLENSGLDHLIEINDPSISYYDAATISKVIEEVNEIHHFDCILILATGFGRMIAPRLAMKLKTGLVADITAVESAKDEVVMIRPAFDGKILAGIICDRSPIMMSVRPYVFKYEKNKQVKMIKTTYISASQFTQNIKLISKKPKPIIEDIRKSDLLVSGGGGVLENFDKLKELSEKINGTVSASRRVVDSGIAPRAIQVGQSGKTVSPKVYLALGIYGSLQHIEGLKNIESIIAVNTNKNAPICSLAKIVVEGDAIEFIDKLIERINKKN